MAAGKPPVAIVDDDPGVCRALARLVRSLGLEAETYGSGEEVLDDLTASGDVLLDLHMPGTHGPELISKLLSRYPSAHVIVMTGLDRPGARDACLAAGAVAYILKPVQRSDLERLLRSE
jgi:FixJ family two-component response regulator